MRRLAFGCVFLLVLAVVARAQNADSVALLKDADPDRRVEGAKRLLQDGDKKSIKAVMEALVAERDGFAGREMGRGFADLKSNEGLNQADSSVMGCKKTEEMFAAYWALCGLALGNTPEGTGTLKKALDKADKKNVSLRACALEAMGEAGRDDLAKLAIDIVNAYTADCDKGNTFENLAAITGVRKLCPKGDDRDAQKPYIEALIHVLEASQDDRIKYFAALGLSRISGKQAYLSAGWWRAWLAGNVGDDAGAGKTVAFFDAIAVGTRVIFVIDVSGSMDWPADMEFARDPVTGKGKEKGPDYSQVKSKLDLAKVELLWTLSNLPEDYYFNIITYSKDHQLILADETELVAATDENKRKFATAVYGLKAGGGTNIHGALTQSFGVVRKGKVKDDPALDPKAMLEGVDTIFFLTDGEPSWSDDSTGEGYVHPKWGSIGNGRYVKPENILADISRVNTFRKVVIHAIAVGKDANMDMMEKLAEQNHGKFINRG
ncbi:MAG: VWA domain-containing protein [Planctomycetes bacterium]|nr:VWA domain-containing protein [Planctomycetota bacterium]